MFRIFALLGALIFAPHLSAAMEPRAGWSVLPSEKGYDTLVADVIAAVKANAMGVVTQAGPTGMAAQRGITIPGNRVIGVFNNDFAVRIIALSVPAMIEAPIRMYVTEDADGTATLSYKTPSHVLSPYFDDAGQALSDIAAELDLRFAAIAAAAR